jgi:hypothetical protein
MTLGAGQPASERANGDQNAHRREFSYNDKNLAKLPSDATDDAFQANVVAARYALEHVHKRCA